MFSPSDSAPPVQTVDLKISPSQVALAGLTLLAVFGAVLLVLRLIDVLILEPVTHLPGYARMEAWHEKHIRAM